MKKPSVRKIDVSTFLDDFRNLDPKDAGAWPLAPRITILIVIFGLILLGGWFVVWADQYEILDQREQEELQLRSEYTSKKRQAVNLDSYRQQLTEIERAFGVLLKQLPDKSEMEALLVEVNQSGMGRGLQFELFKPGQEVIQDFYAELPVNVRLTGNYHDFGEFAGDIGRLSRIVTLGNISIAPNQQAKDGSLVLEAVTRTFRYLDEEELAAKRKAEQEARAKK